LTAGVERDRMSAHFKREFVIKEPKYQNSAGRLLAAISDIDPGQYISQTFPAHFGTQKQSDNRLPASYEAVRLLQQVYQEFTTDILGPGMPEMTRNVLISSLTDLPLSVYPQSLQSQFRQPTAAEKGLIEMAATILPQDKAIEQSDIDGIRESVANLRALIEASELPPSIRNILLDLIRLSEDALSRYKIRGPRGLRTAFVQMLGDAHYLYAEETKKGKREELERSSIWGAIKQHLHVVDKVLAKVQQYQPLLESGMPLLMGGQSP
jgi:hypothetical protein